MAHGLDQARIKFIADLVGHTIDLGGGFKLYPPAEVTRDPGIVKRDDALTKLAETKWWLRFADNREEILSFTELMVFTHNLIAVRLQVNQRRPGPSGQISITTTFSVDQIMTTHSVNILLSRLTLEGIEK